MDEAQRRRLLRWYRANRRDLPWRRTRDPYVIWVSEAMLQQTRVGVAIPYHARWMAAFPDVAALARATEEDVLRLWSGLGYYSRARNLRRAAQAIVACHGGRIPRGVDDLRQLPGVGPYTAAAVASIAFGAPASCVDGNVTRVVARVRGIEDPAGARGRRRVQEEARAWLARRSPGDWNQAVMELGATVCTPKAPRCDACPLADTCEARRTGRQAAIPRPKRRAPAKPEAVRFAAAVQAGHVLLVRNPPGLLAGMWSLPGGPARSAGELRDRVREQAGLEVRLGPPSRPVVHAFSHRTWSMRVHAATLAPPAAAAGGPPSASGPQAAPPQPPLAARPGTRWVPLDALGREAIPTAARVALRAAGIRA